MGKSPAFLFYPSDWIEGTMLFTRLEKACYLDLLLAQNANGHLSIDNIKHILDNDFPIWESTLHKKFKVDSDGLFYNEKMEKVQNERRQYVKGRLDNLHKSLMGYSYGKPIRASHGGDGNGNRDRDINKGGIRGDQRFDDFWAIYPARRGKKIGKADALKAFIALKEEDKDLIMVAVKNYAASDTLPKDPVRFIRKDYWKEWLEPETTSKLTPSGGVKPPPGKYDHLSKKD